MGTLGSVLRDARRRKRLVLRNVAHAVGVSISAVGQWERDEDQPSTDNLRKACAFLEIDPGEALIGRLKEAPHFVLRGDKPHIESSQVANDDYHVEPDFPPDPDEELAARKKARRQLEPGELVEVDVVGGLGPGGFAPEIVIDGQVVDNLRATWRVPQDFLHTELRAREIDVEIFPVEGDSMIPTLTAGDRVLINRRQNQLSQDGLYAITGPTGVQVKRLQYVQGTEDPVMVEVISDNPQHSKREVPMEQIRIIGRVICRISRL